MKIRSIIDDKKKAKVREAMAKRDPSLLWPKRKLETEPARNADKKAVIEGKGKKELDAELVSKFSDGPYHDKRGVMELLEKGADPNAVNRDGECVLLIATRIYCDIEERIAKKALELDYGNFHHTGVFAQGIEDSVRNELRILKNTSEELTQSILLLLARGANVDAATSLAEANHQDQLVLLFSTFKKEGKMP